MLSSKDTLVHIVDDDSQQRRYLSGLLAASGFQTVSDSDGQSALERLNGPGDSGVHLMLLDLNMPGMDGIEVLRALRQRSADLPVLVLTSDGSLTRAVEAMKAGASDFLVKPVAPERLEISIRNALEMRALSSEVRRLASRDENRLSFDELVAEASATRSAIELARRAARSDIPVLIEGESGTGKEVFARAIHGESSRSGGPFVAVNCGALPSNLIESILFGHEKGAFTGATSRRAGKFQEASGGTLFLDEIGELPAEAQVKLLRALQSGEVDPVGGSAPRQVDIRLVSATNRDLAAMVAEGTFREDLYYRLSVFPMLLPPLRDRRDDLPGLATAFLRRFAVAEGRHFEGFTDDALRAMAQAKWPGNVRQLQNTIHRAVVMAAGPRVTAADLVGIDSTAPAMPGRRPGAESAGGSDPFLTAEGDIKRLCAIEAEAIRRALKLYHGRMSETARRLGIGRSTLYRKIEELGIPKDMR